MHVIWLEEESVPVGFNGPKLRLVRKWLGAHRAHPSLSVMFSAGSRNHIGAATDETKRSNER